MPEQTALRKRVSSYFGQAGTNPSTSLYDDLNSNNVLQDLFKEKPGLKKFQDPSSTNVLFSDALKGGGRQLEYWPKTEDGTVDNPHPNPGNTTLEIFNPDLKRNPKMLKDALYGDLLHGMTNDPNLSAMRKQFSKNFTPQSLDFENSRGGINNSRLDAYIRGYLAPDQDDEWRINQQKHGDIYSPKQLEILTKMQRYLGNK